MNKKTNLSFALSFMLGFLLLSTVVPAHPEHETVLEIKIIYRGFWTSYR